MLKSLFTAITIVVCASGVCFGQEENSAGKKQANQGKRRPGMNRNAQRGQQNGFNAEAVFKRLDKNGDGVLTSDEVPARMQNRMKALDKDGSNSVSLQELSAIQNQRGGRFQKRNADRGPGKSGNRNNAKGAQKMDGTQAAEFMFRRLDKNGDGVIAKSEAPDRMQARFAKMDKNGNDQLDQNEIVAVLEILKAEGGKMKGRYNTDPSKTRPVEPKRPPRK